MLFPFEFLEHFPFTISAESRGSSKMGTEDSGSTRDDASSVASGSVEGKKHRKKRKKDFIKRNKEVSAKNSLMHFLGIFAR